jgi:hypothetical protein
VNVKIFSQAATNIILGSALLVSAAHADQLKRATIACVSEDLFDEYLGYVNKGDKDGKMQLLLSGQCIVLSSGETVSVISPGFMIATIRYQGTKLFTNSEAVR